MRGFTPGPAAHRDRRSDRAVGPPYARLSNDPTGVRRAAFLAKGMTMSKEKNKGNKETKKPKKEKPKVLATANSGSAKADMVIGGKKMK